MSTKSSALLHSDFKTTPYWWEAAGPEDAPAALPPEVDVAVVGSGYCGLCAAIELARNGKTVAVIDKGPIGNGGSTRSGGMVSSGQKLVVTGAVKGLSADRVGRLLSESLKTFEFLKTFIAENQLDADLQLNGRFFGAYTPAHYERLQRHGQLLREKTGVTVHTIAPGEQRRVIGSDFYYGGIVVDEYGGLHVSKYHRALRELAKREGATLHSHAGLLRIESAGGGHVLHTERGRLRAANVLMATNGYTDAANPYLHRRVIPVASYQIATAPLPRELMDELNPGRRMISDSQRNLYYSRPSPDGTRILFGSRPVVFDAGDIRAADKLYRAMLRVHPQLSGVPITHAWSGYVAMTFDKQAHIGIHDGIHYAVGCNGNGVALMSYLGWRVARGLLAQDLQHCAFAESDLLDASYYGGHPWFVPAATAMYETADRWDARQRKGRAA